jgi:L-amino acid N-acyltransferase YncA
MNKPLTLDTLKDRATFRFAEEADLDELMHVYERFYAEAVYKDFLDWDATKARSTVRVGIMTDVRPHILAIVDDVLAGFLSYVLDGTFSTKPCMVLLELYVIPEYRRSAIGRALVGMAILEGQAMGAGAFHAPVASGMAEARTLFNLFSKAGFTQFGFMLRRKL